MSIKLPAKGSIVTDPSGRQHRVTRASIEYWHGFSELNVETERYEPIPRTEKELVAQLQKPFTKRHKIQKVVRRLIKKQRELSKTRQGIQ